MHHESVQQCQLSEAELRGFIAEADIDERDEIGYVDHIKMWVPIIFELRKSRVYDSILAKDWGVANEGLIDLSGYEETFPLLLTGDDQDRGMQRRPSLSRNSQRRPSSRGARMSRSSTKGNDIEVFAQMQRRGTKEKGRPASRTDKQDRPRSREKKTRPASRTTKRTDSSESVSSRASMCSHASHASHASHRSGR